MAKKPIDLIVHDEAHANAAYLEEEAPKETRGEKKRKATQLERLGELLVKLPAHKLARVPMPDDLAAAVTEARRITAHGGYRRQIQFIGRIMRTVDAQPMADAIERLKDEDAPSAASFQAAERWRTRLIAEGDAGLEILVKDKPEADRTSLRQLIRQAQKEAASDGKKPPHAGRALFRELKALFDGPVEPA